MTMRTFLLSTMLLGSLTWLSVGCDDSSFFGPHRRVGGWRYRHPFDDMDSGAVAQDSGTATPLKDASTSASSSTPPKDPSVDGQCPSFIGAHNTPIWGCCSKFGVCGTFAANTCLLPVGAQIPLDPFATDDGGTLPVGRCIPPK